MCRHVQEGMCHASPKTTCERLKKQRQKMSCIAPKGSTLNSEIEVHSDKKNREV